MSEPDEVVVVVRMKREIAEDASRNGMLSCTYKVPLLVIEAIRLALSSAEQPREGWMCPDGRTHDEVAFTTSQIGNLCIYGFGRHGHKRVLVVPLPGSKG